MPWRRAQLSSDTFSGVWPKNGLTVLRSSGQAPSVLVDLAGLDTALLNIGLAGLLAMAYILAIDGDISGPVIAGLLFAAGFGAFGKHPFNIMPVILGGIAWVRGKALVDC